jgi:hypothetical protein
VYFDGFDILIDSLEIRKIVSTSAFSSFFSLFFILHINYFLWVFFTKCFNSTAGSYYKANETSFSFQLDGTGIRELRWSPNEKEIYEDESCSQSVTSMKFICKLW